MTRREASLILGISPSATKLKVKVGCISLYYLCYGFSFLGKTRQWTDFEWIQKKIVYSFNTKLHEK